MKIISFVFVFIFCSCFSWVFSQDQIPPDLYGTWVLELPGEGEVPSQQMKFVFHKNQTTSGTSEFWWNVKWTGASDYTTIGVTKGIFTLDEDEITVKLTRAGSQQKEPMSDIFLDSIVWYGPDDELFGKFPREEKYTFRLEKNTLFILEDENGDGDTDDEGEASAYIRKK